MVRPPALVLYEPFCQGTSLVNDLLAREISTYKIRILVPSVGMRFRALRESRQAFLSQQVTWDLLIVLSQVTIEFRTSRFTFSRIHPAQNQVLRPFGSKSFIHDSHHQGMYRAQHLLGHWRCFGNFERICTACRKLRCRIERGSSRANVLGSGMVYGRCDGADFAGRVAVLVEKG
jgi:hypothetical protein